MVNFMGKNIMVVHLVFVTDTKVTSIDGWSEFYRGTTSVPPGC